MSKQPKLVNGRKLWDKLEHESEKQFGAFCLYRDMGPDRSLIKSYDAYVGHHKRKQERLPPYFAKWTVENRWVERATEYDKHIESLRNTDSGLWLQRDVYRRERLFEIGSAMLNQAKDMLDYPIVSQKVIDSETGQMVLVTAVKWQDKQVAAVLAKAGADLTGMAISQSLMMSEEGITESAKQFLPDWMKDVLTKSAQSTVTANSEEDEQEETIINTSAVQVPEPKRINGMTKEVN